MNIVFDIGGTSFRYSKYANGVPVESGKQRTATFNDGYTPDEVSRLLLDGINQAVGDDRDKIEAVGISYAGPVSAEGRVLASPTIHGKGLQAPFDLRTAVQELLGSPSVWVLNDLAAAAYRYIDDYRCFELITVSTGIGNKVMIDGQLQIGSAGLEGELGHLAANLPNPFAEEIKVDCSCGSGLNHIDTISSGRGLVEVARQLRLGSLSQIYAGSSLRTSEPLTPALITAACSEGDAFALKLMEICSYPLAYAICLTLTSLYLDKVVLIGGVIANSLPYFDALMGNILQIGVYKYSSEHLKAKITRGICDDSGGLIGMQRYLESRSQSKTA